MTVSNTTGAIFMSDMETRKVLMLDRQGGLRSFSATGLDEGFISPYIRSIPDYSRTWSPTPSRGSIGPYYSNPLLVITRDPSIACDVRGNAFVVNVGHHNVLMFDAEGRFVQYLAVPVHARPKRVTTAPDGKTVYVASVGLVYAFLLLLEQKNE